MLRSIPSSMRSSVGYGLAVADGPSAARCWALTPRTPNPLDLHGPHDLRHTFATWLEDAAIPVRVIDELMGHAGGRRPDQGSRIGRIYRETTPKMLVRVVGAIEQRLSIVLAVAAEEATQHCPPAAQPRFTAARAHSWPGAGPGLSCGFYVEPPPESTGDPILTMNLALTAMRTTVSAGRSRPYTPK
jgi:Phage integrase family